MRTAQHVPAGRDRFRGNKREVFGSRVIDTKVSALDTDCGFCVTEIGDELYELGPDDSLLAPRKVAHVAAG
jgi:hypothetical protein